MGPGLVMRAPQPCPYPVLLSCGSPTCSPLAPSWRGAGRGGGEEACLPKCQKSGTDLGVEFGLQWGPL